VDVCSDHHCILVQKRSEFDVAFHEGYLNVQPFGSHDGTFDYDVINLVIVLSLLPLVFKIQVGASGDGVYGSEGWKIGCLLGRLLVLPQRWRWIAWLYFCLSCLGTYHGIR
jgi:hypothetical protein